MTDLVVAVPSRGRPQAVAELLTNLAETCTANTGVLLALDSDDPTFAETAQISMRFTKIRTVACEPAGHVGAINTAAGWALATFDPFAVAKLDDDHRPRTVGWDARYLEALRELGTGIVYGNDLLQGERLPTAPAMTADIVRTLGFMIPPTLRHLYCDNFWKDLGLGAECLQYLPDVVVEHMHPLAGKSDWDDGYRRANSPRRYTEDGQAYAAYHAEGLSRDIAKVRALRVERRELVATLNQDPNARANEQLNDEHGGNVDQPDQPTEAAGGMSTENSGALMGSAGYARAKKVTAK